ncbi:MAG: twin-arginine translocation signal domain-containing protein [Salinibacter sp.]
MSQVEKTSSSTITRRGFLKRTGAVLGTSVALGPLIQLRGSGQETNEPRELMFVVNNGDGSVTAIDTTTDEVVKTFEVGTTASFPSNKHFDQGPIIATGLHTDDAKTVHIVDLSTGEVPHIIETGSSQNYTELTPDGNYILASARFDDALLKIGANPDNPDFGQVVGRIERFQEAQPCDISITPDGRFAVEPDRNPPGSSQAVSTVDVDTFEVAGTVPVPPIVADSPGDVEPFMLTGSRDGTLAFVETIEGSAGTVGVFDISDPARPTEIKRFTPDDGLGELPITDEFTADDAFNFVINRNSSDITVVDVANLEIVNTISLVEGGNPVAGDFSIDDEKFYVPIQNQDVVAVVDVERQEMIKTIEVGPEPVGAIARHMPVPTAEAVGIGSLPTLPSSTDHHCSLPCCGEV